VFACSVESTHRKRLERKVESIRFVGMGLQAFWWR
jgi:hypothetical protein